jgi:RNA polymerase sigma factor (sigma-70 family)
MKNKKIAKKTQKPRHGKKAPVERPTNPEELKLFRRLKRGDTDARDKLLEAYSSWVINISRKYHNCFQQISLSEMVAEGNQGLLEAMYHFDTNNTARFSTYAWFWIVKNIQRHITSTLGIINIPRRILSVLGKIQKNLNDELKKGKTPVLENISKKMDLDLDTIREILTDKKNLVNPVSLDKFIDSEDQSQTLWDLIEDKSEVSFLDMMDKSDKKINLAEILNMLSPMESDIIKWRFGFVDSHLHALRDVAKKLKMSPSKVKDLESVAIMKLKKLIDESDMYDTEKRHKLFK